MYAYEPPVDLVGPWEAPSLVRLRDDTGEPPLFCIHGLGGHVAVFLPLATHPAVGRTVYAFQAQGLEAGQQPHDDIEAMAAFYLDEMRVAQPQGPYLLAGWSMGGLVALELAHRLRDGGQGVGLLAMFDTHPTAPGHGDQTSQEAVVARYVARFLDIPSEDLEDVPPPQRLEFMAERAQRDCGIGAARIQRLADVCRAHLTAMSLHTPTPYNHAAVLFRSADSPRGEDDPWHTFCPYLRVEQVPGDHYTMLRKPAVDVLAELLGSYLQKNEAGDSRGGTR